MSDTYTISAVINTKNAAETLERTLKSLEWCNEIIVVDMESQDSTLRIAKKYTQHIFSHPDVGYVEPARNMAIAKAQSDWVLVVDADEEIPSLLVDKLQSLASGDATADAYSLPRKNIVFDAWIRHAGWWPDYQLRFFKKGSVVWSDTIHQQPKVIGNHDFLPDDDRLAIIHHNYTSVSDFIERLNRYTSHQARHKQLNSFHTQKIVTAFSQEFFSRLFKLRGIDDGTHGVAVSFLQSFYELVVHLKEWEMSGFPENNDTTEHTFKSLRLLQKQLNYWIADWHFEHSTGLTALWWRIRRKLMV